jgi:U3 small nucleolar RNA-associated protein 3
MAVKRKVRKQGNTEPQFDGGGAKRKAIDTYADIAESDEEAFDAGQDKLLLDGDRRDARLRGNDQEEFSDEEVLELEGLSSESENEDAKGEEEVEEGWGDSKKEYYDAEDITDEEDLKAEETEALRIQKKNLQKLSASAFVDDLEEWNDADETQGAVEALPTYISADLPQAERMRMLKLRYPEFEPFAKEFRTLSPSLEHLDLLAMRKHHPHHHLISLKQGALRSYLAVLAFYFVLLAATSQEGQEAINFKEHDIMISLVRCCTAWQRIELVAINEDASDLVDTVAEPEPTLQTEVVNKRKRKRPSKTKKTPVEAELPSVSIVQDDDDDLEATFAALKSVKKIRPTQALADIGDAMADSQEAEDASQRRRTLQFYASQIAQKSNKRRDASKNAFMSGDADVPYKERRKERDIRVQQEAERRKGGTIGDDLDDEEPASAEAGHSDEEYYNLIAKAAKEEKQQRKAEHDGALKALRAERAGYTLAQDTIDGDKRGVTRDILANKGTREGAKGPNKQNRNARVKKRIKYDAAKKKLASQKAIFKQPTGSYGGESSGISRVIKSTKLDGGMNKRR